MLHKVKQYKICSGGLRRQHQCFCNLEGASSNPEAGTIFIFVYLFLLSFSFLQLLLLLFCPLVFKDFAVPGSFLIHVSLHDNTLSFQSPDDNSNYEELLTKVYLPALHIRRMRSMALETFKILSDRLVKKVNVYLIFDIRILGLQVKSTRQGKKYFRYSAPVLRNSLHDNFRTISGFSKFKTLMVTGVENIAYAKLATL